MYLMVQSCLHVVIDFPWPPKPDQNMLHFSLFRRPLQITEFRKILWKRRNSTETGKFRGLAQNSAVCGPYSLCRHCYTAWYFTDFSQHSSPYCGYQVITRKLCEYSRKPYVTGN